MKANTCYNVHIVTSEKLISQLINQYMTYPTEIHTICLLILLIEAFPEIFGVVRKLKLVTLTVLDLGQLYG